MLTIVTTFTTPVMMYAGIYGERAGLYALCVPPSPSRIDRAHRIAGMNFQ